MWRIGSGVLVTVEVGVSVGVIDGVDVALGGWGVSVDVLVSVGVSVGIRVGITGVAVLQLPSKTLTIASIINHNRMFIFST